MKALVLMTSRSDVMLLECGANWLTPNHQITVEETLGQLLVAKYGLSEVGSTELKHGKWRIERAKERFTKKMAGKKPGATKAESFEKDEPLQSLESTRDMGDKKVKKKTKAKTKKKTSKKVDKEQ